VWTRRLQHTIVGRWAGVFNHVASIILMYCKRQPWGKRSAVGSGNRSPVNAPKSVT